MLLRKVSTEVIDRPGQEFIMFYVTMCALITVIIIRKIVMTRRSKRNNDWKEYPTDFPHVSLRKGELSEEEKSALFKHFK